MPREIVAKLSGIISTIFEPKQTPGIPQESIRTVNLVPNVLCLKCLKPAPNPSATLANLWVARATGNGSPKRIRAGNWINPAPPPEKAERKFAIVANKANPICWRKDSIKAVGN